MLGPGGSPSLGHAVLPGGADPGSDRLAPGFLLGKEKPLNFVLNETRSLVCRLFLWLIHDTALTHA